MLRPRGWIAEMGQPRLAGQRDGRGSPRSRRHAREALCYWSYWGIPFELLVELDCLVGIAAAEALRLCVRVKANAGEAFDPGEGHR